MNILTFGSVVSLISMSDTIKLDIFQNPLQVFLNEDVLLKCEVAGYIGDNIDPKTVGVEWILDSHTEVYSFMGGEHDPKRPGASISDSDLLKGNASLYLPKVQLADEGSYTCTVFIFPESEKQTSTMQVLVRPNVSLSTQSITIPNGSEGSVKCDVIGFYPQQLDISWMKISKQRIENISSINYRKYFVTNSDKTFSVSSQLRIRPTMEDNGEKYRCVVKHSTFPGGFTIESVLSVVESKNHSLAIGATICVLALLGITLGFGIYFWRKHSKGCNRDNEESQSFLKSVSPDHKSKLLPGPDISETGTKPAKISLIQTPFEINEGEESKLDWDVTVFSPEVVNIVIWVKRKGKQEAKILFHWELPASKLSGPKKVIIPLNDASDLCEKDDSFSAEVPELQRMDSGSFLIPCSITLCPDISKDDGAEILIEVKQDTSEKTSTESTVLKVKAEQSKLKESEDDSGRAVEKTICHVEREPAKISLIQTPFEINEGEESKLDWDVTVFSPEVVNIVIWVKRKGKQEAKILFHWELPASKLSGPKKVIIPLNDASDLCEKDDSFSAEAPELQRMDSGSFLIPCSITLCPDISKDDGAEILIEVKQDTSEKTSTESTVLKVKEEQSKLKESEDDSGRAVEKTICHVEREPPKISLIQTPFEINEGEESKLDWDVTVFSPDVVNIVIRVKRKGKQEAKILFHWELPASKLSGPKKVIIPLNDASDLCEKDDSFSAEAPELQRMDYRSFLISCSITLCPDISKDDGAEILIEVKQDTSEKTSTESTVLKVKAEQSKLKESEDDSGRAVVKTICHVERAPPSITEIKKPDEIRHSEPANLSWDVAVSSPEVVSIVTSVKRKGEQEANQLFHWEIPAQQVSGTKG
ncbi:uncharacterized protein [Scyliorhinus torazame]|uniref:uncharacterized protein isoform X1 n=1 Tax=Scyliorhinus torazame TaxID=75743 RepID=UPI003B5AD3BB